MQNFSPATRSLWAKKRTDDNGRQWWLPLTIHLSDAAQASNALFLHWLSPGQQALLAAGMGMDQAQQLVKFLGFTHDIGKATPAFQCKPSYGGSASIDDELIERLVRTGFAGLTAANLTDANKSPHAKAGEAILESFGVSKAIGAIIGGHHGKPLNEAPTQDITTYTANYWQSDHDPIQQQPWRQVQREIFDDGLNYAGFNSAAALPRITQSQAIILEGLLIMGDWLASSESLNGLPDQPLFPLISLEKTVSDVDPVGRFRTAWLTWHLNQNWSPQRVRLDPDPYQTRWHFPARPVQQTVTAKLATTTDPGMVIVEAPMGMGKTELALLAAEQLANKTGRAGVFFGLPTQATASAMFQRVLGWLNHVPGLAKTNPFHRVDAQQGPFQLHLSVAAEGQ